MTTQEVANRLVSLCQAGKYEQVYQELFSPDVKSIEPEGGPWEAVQGLEAIRKKGEEWNAMVEEFISGEVSEPLVADNFFTCTMKSKIRMKGMADVIHMDEICLYEVADGKVIREQFFYTPMPQEV